jgi:hypothetical protein
MFDNEEIGPHILWSCQISLVLSDVENTLSPACNWIVGVLETTIAKDAASSGRRRVTNKVGRSMGYI